MHVAFLIPSGIGVGEKPGTYSKSSWQAVENHNSAPSGKSSGRGSSAGQPFPAAVGPSLASVGQPGSASATASCYRLAGSAV